jgi:hypothetical protein
MVRCAASNGGTVLLAAALAVTLAAQDRSPSNAARDEQVWSYLRVGRYADARKLLDDMLQTDPRADLRNIRATFANGPNMRVRRGAETLQCEVNDTSVRLPLIVNGRPVQWLFDTGASVTIISDAEAARLGLFVHESEGRLSDQAGGHAAFKTAIAPSVRIGRTEIEDAMFLVTPADQMPWKEWAPTRQGIIGLPLALALDALRWTRSGACYAGSAAAGAASPAKATTLRYDRLHVIAPVAFAGKDLEFLLDTGNERGTQLWERFGKEFDTLAKERGRKGSMRVTQFGGSADHDIIVIPEMRLTVGGKETRLGEGRIFARPVGDDRYHGLLGMDLLSQASEVTIDFRQMALTLK